MAEPIDAMRLRIRVSNKQKIGPRPVYEIIVEKARNQGLAGATVLRGVLGFSQEVQPLKAKVHSLFKDTPLVIEIVDKAETIEAFLSELDNVIPKGCITLEKVRMIVYRPKKSNHADGKRIHEP
jgi:uncharacterized protein